MTRTSTLCVTWRTVVAAFRSVGVVASLVVVVVVAGISACSTAPVNMEEGMAPMPLYQIPARYSQHRAQQRYFETPHGNIAYTDHGVGQVIVLVHGVPTSSWMYRRLIPILQSSARVITIDLLGYGSSDKPEDDGANYTVASQAKNVVELLGSLDVPSYTLVVHDMGGLIGWRLLNVHGASVDGLVVLNTIVQKEGFNHPKMKPGFLTRQITRAYSGRGTSAAVLSVTFRSLGLTGEYELSEAECFGYVAPLREGSDAALYQFFTSIDANLFEAIRRDQVSATAFSGKTLVLWGSKDDILTTAQLPYLQQLFSIPDHRIHIYPENKHFLAEEIPGEVASQILEFMSD